METSNCENIVVQALIDSSATGLDAALFSSNAAVAGTGPAGILFGLTPIAASTNAIPFEAMCDDLCKLVEAIALHAGNGNVIFVASPAQAMRVMLQVENSPLVFALGSGQRTVVCIAKSLSLVLLSHRQGAVGELVGIDGGVVSGVINLELSGV